MSRSIALVTLVVKDYDEAIFFFTDALRFTVVEDKPLGDGKRWVVVATSEGAALLLAKATTEEQHHHIGCQTGGRIAFFLETYDFWDDYHHMKLSGINFAEEPREELYGIVVVFFDLYGNKWDLLQRK